MPQIQRRDFDKKVTERIVKYIADNELSTVKVAEAAGMTYQRLYQMLYRKQVVQLYEYVRLCEAFDEPLGFFLTDREGGDSDGQNA